MTTDDLERIRVADTPDFGYELALGGAHLARRHSDRRLSAWRREVAGRWKPGHSRLFDLYTHVYMPAFFDQVARPPQTATRIDAESAPAVAHLRDLARSRALTKFTRALADGHVPAVTALNQILTDLRTVALDPFRRRITSAIATASARAQTCSAIGGTGDMLSALHPSVRWDGRTLCLNTVYDGEESLADRPLILQPSALATQVTYNPLAESVTVSYPAAAVIMPDPEIRTQPQALESLLGATRAAALATVVQTPAVTNGDLAMVIGVSAAAASRHAAILRESGLIATIRHGQAVHHHPTRLGKDLVEGANADG